MLALVPAVALFAAVVASLISSRVRTFNAAQNMSGLVLLPIMFAFFALAAKMQDWGPLALFAGVAAILVADVALVILSAATWRREEVLAKR
jgi:ABC-2 type transport system permease protein